MILNDGRVKASALRLKAPLGGVAPARR